jgi:hypothetical protein
MRRAARGIEAELVLQFTIGVNAIPVPCMPHGMHANAAAVSVALAVTRNKKRRRLLTASTLGDIRLKRGGGDAMSRRRP